MLDADFALFNVDQLITMAAGAHPEASGPLGILRRAALAARNGKIVWIGTMDDFHANVRLGATATVVNPHGRVVLPGFVDPHTHLIFAGTRVDDFYRRALGERYQQQLKSSGIMQTVRATRAASEDALVDLAFDRAEQFLRNGITTVEGKTGYGLTREDEIKSLRALTRLQRLTPLKIVPAFLGAHMVPHDYQGDADAYVQELIDGWLPEARGLASMVDVWCDEGALSVEQCRRILQAARDMGFALTAHANEMGPHGGASMAAGMGALSVDHVVYLQDDDIAALADSETVAVLLPATTLFLGSDTYAPARRLIDAGVRVALGTDFNPGTSYIQSMQLVLSLAVLKLKMTPEEAIQAATIHAAAAVGMQDRIGSLEVGKFCDLSVFTVEDYRAIPYHLGANLVDAVVAGGEVVVQDGRAVRLTSAHPA
jgi:imidazolonepropionase